MMSRVFLTGGSGFLGSRLCEALRLRGNSIIALDRSGSIGLKTQSGTSGTLETVKADLLEPEAYEAALATADVAIHLAARTGRASEEEHFRVNARGTEVLLDRCRKVGVKRFLFVSTIATKFPNLDLYPYAKAKARAEDAVRASGLSFTIVRPTIILGRGSQILATLDKLAGLPVIPVFGNGKAAVQPIYVDDLVDFLVAILDQNLFEGKTLELGGPTVLTIEQLLQGIRRARSGVQGRSMHLPMSLLVPPLWAMEAAGLGRFLPVSAGQLSSFRYDGIIEDNSLFESRRAGLRSLPEMLALSFAA